MPQIVVESSYGSIWREIMEGITWFAGERHLGWQINCVTTTELPGAMKLKPDGMICLLRPAQRALVRRLAATRIPAVNMLRNVHPRMPAVMSDNTLIGRRAADYLHGQGFRHFRFVGVDRIWSAQRQAGFCGRLAELGHPAECCTVPLEVGGLRAVEAAPARRALQKWLAALPRPAALFACADFVGRALVEACGPRGAGLAVPEDVAVLGVDNDLAICDLTRVPLSSIPQNMRRIGFEAARLLDGLMKHRRQPRGPLHVPPLEVVARRSTDFIAVDNPHVAAALRLIHAGDLQRLHVAGLLRQTGVSRQWLDRQFRAALGTTPAREIRGRKLAAAKSLLLQTHLPVQTIARRAGFTRGENLARFFQEHVGMSPRDFRRQHGFVA